MGERGKEGVRRGGGGGGDGGHTWVGSNSVNRAGPAKKGKRAKGPSHSIEIQTVTVEKGGGMSATLRGSSQDIAKKLSGSTGQKKKNKKKKKKKTKKKKKRLLGSEEVTGTGSQNYSISLKARLPRRKVRKTRPRLRTIQPRRRTYRPFTIRIRKKNSRRPRKTIQHGGIGRRLHRLRGGNQNHRCVGADGHRKGRGDGGFPRA